MSKRNSIFPATLAAGALVLATALGAYGQLQTGGQQACLNSLNKDGAAVAKEQGKQHVACLKNAGKGVGGSAQTCLTADAKGTMAKKKTKTTADETKSCGAAPSFGYTSAATVNAAAQQADLDLTADVYGANLDPAVLSCASNKPGCLCQQKVSKSLEALAAVKLSEFVKCKKAALKGGAASATTLANCVNDAGTAGSIAADTKGKIAKTVAALNAGIVKSCDTPGVTASAFPGSCTALTGSALGGCLDARVECRVCQAINDMDGLFVNCDVFDDGVVNASCVSGTGPTPTPAPTATPVPGFKGALGPPTTGLFNYAGVGIPGSDAACNTNFPGSHTCTYAELQTWDAANQLVGAVDTNSNPVTDFWAIDSTQPGTRQCDNPVPWGYATAHTGHFGDKVPLTAGHLGALQPSQVCAFTSWVGCCV